MVIIVFRAVSILVCFVEQKQPVSHIQCAEHYIEKKKKTASFDVKQSQ